MNYKILFITSLLLIVGCSKPINDDTLIEKGELKYHPDTKELFSGKVFKKNSDGWLIFEGSYKDGIMWSKTDWKWYKNGQVKAVVNYEDGKKSGISITNYEDGQMEVKINYKDGKLDGLFTEWYENGNKRYEGSHKDGEPDIAWTHWYENGQKKEEVTFKKRKKRERLVTEWYENGQKLKEETYEDGELISEINWRLDGSVIERTR